MQEEPSSSRNTTPVVVSSNNNEDGKNMLFHSQMKNEKKPSFSPEVSPINGILQDTLRDSHLD